MSYAQASSRPRAPAVALVVAIHGLIAWAFVTGLAYTVVETASEDLKTFDVIEPVPPAPEPVPEPEPAASENPTPVETSPSPVPTDLNPLSRAPNRGAASPGGAAASAASLLRGAFNNDSDYPAAARREEEQGTVRVSFTVGTDGRVGNCTVVASSGSSSLDSTTCRIFERRFRYSPARDSSGNAVPTSIRQSVTWRLT
ncbi:MAG TPA: energy transducer TonB [Allosphingosinicella sp.]|nr:energy transducer TonB [Allosphingosinicella sp.]